MADSFPALPGFYRLLFLHLEPLSTITPVVMAWVFPGAAWFHHQLIPSEEGYTQLLDPRTKMMVWQLANCYFLLGLLSSVVFRAVRDGLAHDLATQERILGASLFCLAVADVSHIAATFVGLPQHLRYDLFAWNSMTHGNITAVVVLCAVRVAWFLGIGRTSYYYRKTTIPVKRSKSS